MHGCTQYLTLVKQSHSLKFKSDLSVGHPGGFGVKVISAKKAVKKITMSLFFVQRVKIEMMYYDKSYGPNPKLHVSF